MVLFEALLLLIAVTAIIGCSALDRPADQQPKRAEQNEKQKPDSVPTFTYRPGAGLTIEGR